MRAHDLAVDSFRPSLPADRLLRCATACSDGRCAAQAAMSRWKRGSWAGQVTGALKSGTDLAPGTPVLHATHGKGSVREVDMMEKRGKPVLVAYEAGELQRYSVEAARKLAWDAMADVAEGTEVWHALRGKGTVRSLDILNAGKPVLVAFESGETQRYSVDATRKLKTNPDSYMV